MSNLDDTTPPEGVRCATCDTLNAAMAELCIGCGAALPKPVLVEADAAEPEQPLDSALVVKEPVATPANPETTTHPLIKIVVLALFAFAAFTAWRSLTAPGPTPITIAELPTFTPTLTMMPTGTFTPVPSATATLIPSPTMMPTATPTPFPTPTVQPPITHTITSGQVLVGLSIFYNVSIDSIVSINPGLSADTIQAGQSILIPLPTATPPLEPVEILVNGESAIADPADCIMHTIAEGDNYFAIAQRYNVTLDAILQVNRLSQEAIVRPGDGVCIPTVIFNATIIEDLSVFDRADREIVQPRLLFPPPETVFDPDAAITLQWIAERDLAADEWYMVELTDLTDATSRPHRAFTRQTSLQVPSVWQTESDSAEYRWRVSFITVTGQLENGQFTYAFNGPASEADFAVKSSP